MEPVSSLLRLAGEAERPDMSLVRLDTRAEVSDWAEFCLVRPGVSPLREALGWLEDMVRPTGYAAGTQHLTLGRDLCLKTTVNSHREKYMLDVIWDQIQTSRFQA